MPAHSPRTCTLWPWHGSAGAMIGPGAPGGRLVDNFERIGGVVIGELRPVRVA